MDLVQLKARIQQIHADLDRYSYYELLKVPADASTDEIQQAFHRMALLLHPDRYHGNEDSQFLAMLGAVYRRIAEGYRVLGREETRNAYDETLASGQLRLVQTERKRSGPERPEESIEDPRARKFFILGLEAERSGDLQTARLQYKFAMDLAGEHPAILKRVEWIRSVLEGKK